MKLCFPISRNSSSDSPIIHLTADMNGTITHPMKAEIPYIGQFTHADVVRATGILPSVLQDWVNREVIKLETGKPGRGKKRQFTEIDLIKIGFMKSLNDFGVPPLAAADIAEAFQDRAETALNYYEEGRYFSPTVGIVFTGIGKNMETTEVTLSADYPYILEAIDPDGKIQTKTKPFDFGMYETTLFFRLDEYLERIIRELSVITAERSQ